MASKKYTHGFTLVELMVVIAIIVVMLSIISAAIAQARENSREKERVSDLANIEFALTLAKEKDRNYPAHTAGVEIGVADVSGIDDVIRLYNGNIYTDPSSEGAGGTYGYWYDSNFTCSDTGQAVIYAKTMEQSKNANFDAICTSPSADTSNAGSGSYIVVLKQ